MNLGLIGLAAALVGMVASFFFGMDVQEDRHQAQLLVQERAMHDAYVKQVAAHRAIAQQTAKELQDEATKRESDAVSFRDELRRARASGKALAVCPTVSTDGGQTPGVDRPAQVRLLEPRLTGEFARLYDRALEIGVSRPRDPERVDAPAPRPDSIDPADVLANHGENAEAWAECRTALRGWQSLARRYGWAQ